jgi:hypothetical protein
MNPEDFPVRKLSYFFLLFSIIYFLQNNLFAQTRLLPDPSATLTERFGKVPAPGVHPRVLIGPDELMRRRQLMQSTEVGKYTLGKLEGFLVSIHAPGKPLTETYAGLTRGDLNAAANLKDAWLQSKLPLVLLLESYDAILHEDQARGRLAAEAVTTYASIPRNWWENDSELMYLALAYDFDYSYMTDAQRRTVRQTIASGTAGKKPDGWDMPSDFRLSNWQPRGAALMLSALAIEGEEGYDTSIYPETQQVMKDFLHYGISPSGGGLEEIHYFNYGMGTGALALIAMSRHGDDLVTEPNYRAVPNWLIASMEPFGDAFSMHMDTPNDQGGADANYVLMKWLWSSDPVVDMVWRNYVETNAGALNYYGNWLTVLFFPSDPVGWKPWTGPSPRTNWGLNEAAIPTNYPDAVRGIEALKLPLSYWDPERGLLITRNKWGRDGMVLHLDMNTEANFAAGHAHSNSGAFTFSALGRKWGIDRGFHISETKDSSCILIDGRGQGFFPVGGATVEHREEPNLTVIAGDASEPYHWITRSKVRSGSPGVRAFHFEPDTSAETQRRFDEIVTNKAQPWNDRVATQYPYHAVYNPVQRAFRTATLRRNALHDYVLIIDDIQKDGDSHQYDWLMQAADDLQVKSHNGNSIVLGSADAKDNRRLLVQMIGGEGGSWIFENYDIQRTPESDDTRYMGKGNRLRYSVRAVDPEFKVLLYPYREGEALPQASASRALEVRWANQKDEYELTRLPTGRTEVRMR